MPSPCAPVPVAPPVDRRDDFSRPLRGCGLAGVREVAAFMGPPSKSMPKPTTTASTPGPYDTGGR